MAQLTIYIDDEVISSVKSLANAANVSVSQWVADAIRLRMKSEWPESVRALAGAWSDFPTAEELREQVGKDALREPL